MPPVPVVFKREAEWVSIALLLWFLEISRLFRVLESWVMSDVFDVPNRPSPLQGFYSRSVDADFRE